MKDLFKERDADFCTVNEYVDVFLNEENKYFNIFQLPPIQRNSVWNVSQIERLWDSILRGYPIGSFLVSPRTKQDKARDLYTGIQNESASEGYFLLDGQQRTRALLLGFKPNIDARIWIDLNPSIIFDDITLNDRKFLLRVITKYQPWGMNDRNPEVKLHENQKLDARNELKIERVHYDYEVNIDNGINVNECSWPVKAILPIPLDKLIQLCGGTSGKFLAPKWDIVCKLIPDRYQDLGKIPEKETESYKLILEGIKQLIDTPTYLLKTRSIVLLFQKESKTEYNENIKDNMEVLFVRINSGGTVLKDEEMNYSLLKSSWDGAYEMVSKIINDKSIGYLLSQTKIVMVAARLTRFIQKKNDSPKPTISNFRSWIGEKEDKDSFLAIIKRLLKQNDEGFSKMHEIMQAFCKLTLYREINPADNGLPKKLLLSIHPTIYQPVLTWIFQHNCNKEVLENSRNNILRYLVYCFITVSEHDKSSRIAIEVLQGNIHEHFPDKIIFDRLLENEFTVKIPTPDEFFEPFIEPADGFFRQWNVLFDGTNDPYNSFRKMFWREKKELLLWFQRSSCSKWFKGYDPTSDDSYDTPYDMDHITPRSHLIIHGKQPKSFSNDTDLNNRFMWNRELYVNSIGNNRIWPFWANRSDSNVCHNIKLRMDKSDWDNDFVAKQLNLNSVHDFFEASAISINDEELWYQAGVCGDVRDWPEKRRIAWQIGVEKRVIYLYSILFASFNFEILKD